MITIMVLSIHKFKSWFNSNIQKTLAYHLFTIAKLCSVPGSSPIMEIMGLLPYCTFTNSKSFDPINGNLLERHSLTDCLIASSLPFSSTDYIPFVITVSPTCSSAHFKTANSKAFFLLCPWFAAVFQVQTRPVLPLAS